MLRYFPKILEKVKSGKPDKQSKVFNSREGDFKEDDAIWKGEEGGVAGGLNPGGLGTQGGTQGGYIAKYVRRNYVTKQHHISLQNCFF